MKTALLLIDIQNDYFPGGKMELVGMEEACANASAILEEFRKRNIPVFHVMHLSMRPGSTFFLPGTEGAEINDEVAPVQGETVIEKHFPNAFRETVLLQKLKEAEIEELVICGAMTHMCVDATVRAAFDLGFKCVLIEDACATRNLQHREIAVKSWKVHAAFFAALGSVYAKVMRTNEYLGDGINADN